MNGVSVCTASTLAREMSYLTELSALSVCSPLETSWTWFPWLRALWSWTLSVCSVTRRQHTLRDWGQRKRWGRGDMIYIRAEEGSYSRNITCLSDSKVVFPWTSGSEMRLVVFHILFVVTTNHYCFSPFLKSPLDLYHPCFISQPAGITIITVSHFTVLLPIRSFRICPKE